MTQETDRELLMLAAKAAGYDYAKYGGYIVVDGIPGNWNPLTDDGDAFRLAVDLGLDLLRTEKDVEAVAALPPHVDMNASPACAPCAIELIGDDPRAATRRAIVRAAAEIGRKMK